ncbi:MAG TPA: HAD family hydrolase [Planctomycetota bacterium]|nr:HAD family hydrolase [Planctomycetota bacterium]
MTIRALLLDAGGTLLSERTSRHGIYAAVARRHGIAVEDETMRACMARTHAKLPRVLSGHWRYSKPWFEAFIEDIFVRQLGLEPQRLALLSAELFRAFADAGNFRLQPGAQELLAFAERRGIRRAVVSNWSPSLTALLDGLGVLAAIDAVLISAVEELEKPDRRLFERALTRLNVRGAEALHVGNDPVQDVRGASECGIHALLLDPEGAHAELGLPSVRALAEIIPWIEKQR